MKIIHDKDGNEWRIPSLSVGLVTRLREEAEFVIGDWKGKTQAEAQAGASELMMSLYDPFVLGKVLWVLLESQAETKGISPKDFALCFDSDQYTTARMAIVETLADFRLPPTVAATVKANLPGELANLENALSMALKSAATESPASSELIPAS